MNTMQNDTIDSQGDLEDLDDEDDYDGAGAAANKTDRLPIDDTSMYTTQESGSTSQRDDKEPKSALGSSDSNARLVVQQST